MVGHFDRIHEMLSRNMFTKLDSVRIGYFHRLFSSPLQFEHPMIKFRIDENDFEQGDMRGFHFPPSPPSLVTCSLILSDLGSHDRQFRSNCVIHFLINEL